MHTDPDIHDTASLTARIEQALASDPAARLGRPIRVQFLMDSTNDGLRELAETGAPEGTTLIALGQSRGRGRRERVWVSSPGKGLYLSVLLRPAWPVSQTAGVALMAARSVAGVLAQAGLPGARVKPPNDVCLHGRKIAGVLAEPRVGRSRIAFIVLGIGLNLSQTREDWAGAGLEGRAISCREAGGSLTLEAAAVALLRALSTDYDPRRAPRGGTP